MSNRSNTSPIRPFNAYQKPKSPLKQKESKLSMNADIEESKRCSTAFS